MKHYKVVGSSTIAIEGSHAPGEEFDANLTTEHEAFLFQIGAIEEVVPVKGTANHGAGAPIARPKFEFRGTVKEED